MDVTEASLDGFREKVRQAWIDRQQTSQTIQSRLPGLRIKAHRHVELIADVLNEQLVGCSDSIMERC